MSLKIVELQEVCEFLDNQRIPVTESDRKPGPYPYYGANGQQDWIDSYIFDEPIVLLAEDGGHFGSKTKPIAYKVTGKCWVNNHAHVLRPKANCDVNYLHRILSFYDVTKFINGTTREKLTKGQAERMPIPLPPLPEQKSIATILEKADRLRRQRRYALELSNTYLQSVFLEMFGDPTTNPNRWRIGQLFQLCSKIVDCPHATPIYATHQTAYACIRSSDIQNGFLDWSTTKYIDNGEYRKRIKIAIPMLKDVVYCREGARFGNAAMIPAGKQVCLGQRMMLFRAVPNMATPEFIWAFLESESTRQQAIRLAGGSASPHLNVGDIKEFVTIIPPLPLQQKFAQIVQKFERLRSQQWEAERQAEHLFQTLLHQAFQGNVDLEPGIITDVAVEDRVRPSDIDRRITGDYVQLQLKY